MSSESVRMLTFEPMAPSFVSLSTSIKHTYNALESRRDGFSQEPPGRVFRNQFMTFMAVCAVNLILQIFVNTSFLDVVTDHILSTKELRNHAFLYYTISLVLGSIFGCLFGIHKLTVVDTYGVSITLVVVHLSVLILAFSYEILPLQLVLRIVIIGCLVALCVVSTILLVSNISNTRLVFVFFPILGPWAAAGSHMSEPATVAAQIIEVLILLVASLLLTTHSKLFVLAKTFNLKPVSKLDMNSSIYSTPIFRAIAMRTFLLGFIASASVIESSNVNRMIVGLHFPHSLQFYLLMIGLGFSLSLCLYFLFRKRSLRFVHFFFAAVAIVAYSFRSKFGWDNPYVHAWCYLMGVAAAHFVFGDVLRAPRHLQAPMVVVMVMSFFSARCLEALCVFPKIFNESFSCVAFISFTNCSVLFCCAIHSFRYLVPSDWLKYTPSND